MHIHNNYPLGDLNTFGIRVFAREFARVSSEEDLYPLMDHPAIRHGRHLVLGGGSNMLFTDDFDGVVIQMATTGKQVTGEEDGKVFLEVKAGESWDGLVAYCVDRGWGGLENLSLIPGQVGASPIQNIGAYGVELREYFHSLTALDKRSRERSTFTAADCRFGYRNSFFKQEGKDRYIILSVTYRLDTRPVIRTRYGQLADELAKTGNALPTISDVRQAVCRIRRSKLPDPEVLGNAGSFFKNPVVSTNFFRQLKERHPGVIAYPEGDRMKLAAGWLIEHAGWKGYRQGDAGVHDKQALVLVNHGKATGKEMLQLASAIRQSVYEKYNITLQPEVNIIN